jgi:hypothetical protein
MSSTYHVRDGILTIWSAIGAMIYPLGAGYHTRRVHVSKGLHLSDAYRTHLHR